jgi:hypothetical protein
MQPGDLHTMSVNATDKRINNGTAMNDDSIGADQIAPKVMAKKVGFRFLKGHPYHPPRRSLDGSEFTRLKKRLVRKLKIEYGPELTTKQKEHINNAAEARARLELRGEQMDDANFVLLVNTERRELECL